MLLTKIKNAIEKIKCKDLAIEFLNELNFRKNVNMKTTLTLMADYLVKDQLERTGILYSSTDDYIQCQVQSLFWEWKREGIINEFEELSEATKAWICK